MAVYRAGQYVRAVWQAAGLHVLSMDITAGKRLRPRQPADHGNAHSRMHPFFYLVLVVRMAPATAYVYKSLQDWRTGRKRRARASSNLLTGSRPGLAYCDKCCG